MSERDAVPGPSDDGGSSRTSDPARILDWPGYAPRWAELHGGYDPRTAAAPVRGWLRLGYLVGCALARMRTPAGLITFVGLLCSVAVPVVAVRSAAGAGALVVLSALADTVDGAVAILRDRAGPLGAVYDAVTDRVAEACWLVALWRLGAFGWLVVCAGALCWLHEYLRARAGAAGLRGIAVVTVAERPTRVIVTALGLSLAGVSRLIRADLAGEAAIAASAVLGLLSLVGFGQLARAVHGQLRR